MLLDENKPTPAVSQLPIDLTAAPSGSSASPSPNKIQKSSKKQVKPAPEQVTRALHSIPEFHQQGLQYGTQPIMSPYTPQAPGAAYSYNALNGAFPHPNAFPTANNFSNGLGISSNGLTSNTFHTDVFQSPMEPKAPMSTRAGGSCCSNSRGENPNAVKTEPNTVVSNGYTMSPLTSYPVQNAPPSTWQGFPSVDGHFSPVGATTNGFQPDMSGFVHHISPKNYANPPDVGFEQLTIPHSGSVTTPDPAQHNSALEARDTSRSCNCGPNCNCFACPDHPYNDVTVQHVQEMGRIIAEDSGTPADESSHQETQSNGIPANDPQMGHPLAESENNTRDSVESAPAPAGQCCGTNGSTLDDDHEAQALESFTADHLMIPDAYYTYEYEIGLPGACAGEAGNCQCGPSCSCLGCLTHGNP